MYLCSSGSNARGKLGALEGRRVSSKSPSRVQSKEESNDGWELVAIHIFESLDMLFQINTGQQAQDRGYGRTGEPAFSLGLGGLGSHIQSSPRPFLTTPRPEH